MKKQIIRTALLLLLSLIQLPLYACDVCQKQQPKILEGITHGTGPQSNWDYVIVTAVAILVMLAFYFSIKSLIKPKEQAGKHIKYSIINQQP